MHGSHEHLYSTAFTPIKTLILRFLGFRVYFKEWPGLWLPGASPGLWDLECLALQSASPSPGMAVSTCLTDFHAGSTTHGGPSCCDGTEGAPPKGCSPSVTEHNRDIRQTLSWRIQDAFVDNFHSSVLLRDFLRLQDSLAHSHLTISPSPSLQSDLHSNLMTPAFPGPLPISFEAGIATSHVSYHHGVCFSEAPYLYDGLLSSYGFFNF